MWRITFIEDGERKQDGIYSMSEDDARESFKKCHPNGKLLSIYYDSSVSE